MSHAALSNEEVLKRYMETIVAPKPSGRPFVVGMVGLVGSGKSTVAGALAEKFGVLATSNDAIRRFMNTLGFEGESPNQPLLQFVAEGTTKYLASRKISHVIDNDLLKFVDAARGNIESQGMDFYLVEVICPEDIILERLARRTERIASGKADSDSRAGETEYFRRKQVHAQTPRPAHFDFTFDTSKDVAAQADDFSLFLKSRGNL
jgi:predicted kinase